MMQFAHAHLSKVTGCSFYKLMGSGRGMGFNPLPDFSTYGLVQVWDDEASANDFFQKNEIVKKYKKQSHEIWTLYMKNIAAHGAWSGANPFQKSDALDSNNEHIAIITRARIKVGKLYKFWKYVPTSQKQLKNHEGLIYTKGIGEIPIIQMATFSLWTDLASVKKFAYESKEHKEAINRTKKLKWYSEELFSRFQPYKSIGTWTGEQLLSGFD